MSEVLAALATIPGRAHFLPRVLASLRPHVDRLHVYLNGHAEVPACVREMADDFFPDPSNSGAERKLHWSSSHKGIYLSCDDDFCYLEDYVSTMVAAVEHWGGRALVTAHGRTYLGNANSFHSVTGPIGVVHKRVDNGRWVNHAGSGVMAWDTTKVAVPHELPGLNMVDMQVAVWAQRARVPIWLVPHKAHWLEALALLDPKGIFKSSQAEGHRRRNELVRSLKWKLNRLD